MRTDACRAALRGSRHVVALVTAMVVVAACGGQAGSQAGGNAQAGSTAPAIGSAAPLYSQLPERIQKAGEIVVSNPLSNPPYAYLDTDGKTLHGIAPDLSRSLEPLLGVKFRWVNTPFPGLMPGLQAHRFDMIWGSVTDTKQREAILDFVAYQKEGSILLVKGGNPDKIADITSLCGKVASALAGSVQIALLTNQSSACTAGGQPAINVKVYQSVADAELAVRSGNVSTFFAGFSAALYQARTAGDGHVYATTGPLYDAQVYGAGFRKDDRQLATAVQNGIQRLVNDGTYQRIFDQYGLGQAKLTADEVTINGARS